MFFYIFFAQVGHGRCSGVSGPLCALIVVVLEWLEAGIVHAAEDMDRLGIQALGAIPAESVWRH